MTAISKKNLKTCKALPQVPCYIVANAISSKFKQKVPCHKSDDVITFHCTKFNYLKRAFLLIGVKCNFQAKTLLFFALIFVRIFCILCRLLLNFLFWEKLSIFCFVYACLKCHKNNACKHYYSQFICNNVLYGQGNRHQACKQDNNKSACVRIELMMFYKIHNMINLLPRQVNNIIKIRIERILE